MRRWALLTVLFYAVALAVFTLPVLAFLEGLQHQASSGTTPARLVFRTDWAGWFDVYREWSWWVAVAVLLGGQALLLLVPLDVARGRPTPRRRLWVTIVAGAFFLGVLTLGICASVLVALLGDDAGMLFDVGENPLTVRLLTLAKIPITSDLREITGFIIGAALGVGAWASWAVIFFLHGRPQSAEGLHQRLMQALFRGSILEFLIAVPTHVIVRQRGDCCAPAGSAFGIATGLAIMLLAFGPGVFFLFVARARRLKSKPRNALMPPPGSTDG